MLNHCVLLVFFFFSFVFKLFSSHTGNSYLGEEFKLYCGNILFENVSNIVSHEYAVYKVCHMDGSKYSYHFVAFSDDYLKTLDIKRIDYSGYYGKASQLREFEKKQAKQWASHKTNDLLLIQVKQVNAETSTWNKCDLPYTALHYKDSGPSKIIVYEAILPNVSLVRGSFIDVQSNSVSWEIASTPRDEREV